jgi:oxygen-dependent protoporphyrinogen oxidase
VSEIRQVSSAVVTLGYRTADLPRLHGYGFVVPSVERRRITGVTYTSQKWDGRSPGPDWSLIRAFVGGADGQQLAVADHDRLVATARDELASLAGITAQPALVRSQSWQGGFHQYTLGHLERVSRAESALSAHPGLYLAGGAFHGIGLNECIDSGRRAADAALGFLSANQAVKRPDSLIKKQISS